MKTRKRDLFVIISILTVFFITLMFGPGLERVNIENTNGHGFGPEIPLQNYNHNNLITVAILGLIITMISAVLLERNVSKIASKTGHTIGTLMLALASSLPLLIITIMLAFERRLDLILINIIGANIANFTLVLGTLSFFKPLNRGKSFQRGFLGLTITLISLGIIFFIIPTSFNVSQEINSEITRFDGFILIGILILFLLFLGFFKSHEGTHLKSKNLGKEIFLAIFFGLTVAWFASTTVKSLILIAEHYAVPTIIIGSVIGVIGASLPELAIGLVCLIKKEHEAIFSNIVTSNIVNFNLGLGIATIIAGTIMIDEITLLVKIPFMILTMCVSTFFFLPRTQKTKFTNKIIDSIKTNLGITRFEGFMLLILFGMWIFVLIMLA
ncbi:MAG: hypothetical protein ACLFN8_04155 [Candidatus Woesearchaeota archaeon]